MEEDYVRRGISTLRLLLIEGAFREAWRFYGNAVEPCVYATDVEKIISRNHLNAVHFCIALGLEFNGTHVNSITAFKPEAYHPNVKGKPVRRNGHPDENKFPISRYLESASAYVEGRWMSRREVIQHIAYNRFGIHIKATKAKHDELAETAALLNAKIQDGSTDILFSEVIAIAQAVGRSPDAQALMRQAG